MARVDALPVTVAHDLTVDVLIVGSGTGMAAALAARRSKLSALVVEKTEYVGGSTARSGGAFWIPATSLLRDNGARDSAERAGEYLDAVVGDTAPAERRRSYLQHGEATVELLKRATRMRFFWAAGYSDYHPELPGGTAAGRSCECRPFDVRLLGAERDRLRPAVMAAPVPMPVTGADYKWMNLMARKPTRAIPRIATRAAQGIGGLLLGREYVAGGQALAAGLYDGVRHAGVPVWTKTSLVELTRDGDRVTGAVLEQNGNRVTVTARRGVILAAGGFDHDLDMRREFQSPAMDADLSLGSRGNTGDAIKLAQEAGAELTLMDQSWWFPALAPLPGQAPLVLLAERSLPGSLIVDGSGRRFINEATDYMSFGQRVLARERDGNPVGRMWLVFDQRYRDSYVLAGSVYPRMKLPNSWYEAGIAHRSPGIAGLAEQTGLSPETLSATVDRFNMLAANGSDEDFDRGRSAYDRYYGDPTVVPNPNLRPLSERGPYYAVQVVLSDLGTCGGVRADRFARVLRADDSVIDGLYATGNTAGNAFGASYPGAGATIGQGLVFGYIAARHAAGRLTD